MSDWRLLLRESGSDGIDQNFRQLAAKATHIRIASAFVSPFAAQGVLDGVQPTVRPIVVVGRVPSTSQISGIEELRSIAEVRIWTGSESFHPKVYLFECGAVTAVILGSSNFTGGGFRVNVEANFVTELPSSDSIIIALVEQFNSWLSNSAVVTDEWLAALRRLAAVVDLTEALLADEPQATSAKAEIDGLIAAENERREAGRTAAMERARATRAFFKPEHFAAFVPAKQRSEDATVVRERKAVSQRFRELHDRLLPVIRSAGWDLHPHPNDQNLTSSWHLVPGFVPEISAMWLSYGRSKERFRELRDHEADDVDGFYNHTKLQVLIDQSTLRIGLMIAQRNNTWDRDFLKKKMGLTSSPIVRNEATRILSTLQSAGALEHGAYLERESNADRQDRERVDLIDLDLARLISIVSRDDRGNWFGVWVDFAPDDSGIAEGAVLETTRRIFDSLYQLYDLLAYYPGKR